MRSELLRLMEHPRQRLLNALELDGCPRDGIFTDSDRRCRRCHQRFDCEWLSGAKQAQARPTEDLLAELECAVWRVEDLAARGRHRPSWSCECTTCRWLCDAQDLLEQCRTESGFDVRRSRPSHDARKRA